MNKRLLNFLSGFGLSSALVTYLASLYSRKVDHQSLSSQVVNRYLENLNMKEKTNYLANQDIEESILTFKDRNRLAIDNPYGAVLKNHREIIFDGMQVFLWGDDKDHLEDQDILLYFHGGGYIFQPNSYQFYLAARLASDSGARVVMPIYPKAPEYTFDDALPKLLNLYQEILENKGEDSKIHILGDSAGGGLALGFTYYLIDHDYPQPDHLILISPWLDISNSHPDIEQANEREAWFDLDGLDIAGIAWAGGSDRYENKYISPKFHSTEDLDAALTIFVGTHETFYYDIVEFVEDIKAQGKDYYFEIGPNQYHDYPLYPTLEGNKARSKMVERMEEI